jgi:outer membrane protein assembly factor BamB
MLFVQGEGCACQSPIRGNIALAPASVDKAEAKPDKSERLVKGKAFDAALKEDDASWPCSRGDLARNGKTSEKAAAALHPLWTWQKDTQGPEDHATNVAVDHSRVYFGSTDHCIYALDCATGKTAWRRICDGAIHISPFLWKGRVFIGDDGGTVRCLNAENGEDIWNFRATLGVNQLIADGRPISRWPVMSGVVIGDETAYFCAGMFPDDGAMIYALDAKTGVEKWQQAIEAHSGNFKSAFAARGEMALANGHLFIPSGASNVWEIDLQGKDHAPQAVFNNAESHTKGEQIMIAGNKVIAVSPNLQFIHHVRILTGDPLQRLPVVDEAGGRLFIPNQRLPDGALYLAAGKKAAFDYDLNHQAAIFALRKEYKEKALEECVYWKAWKNEQMTALIQSGDTLFSGGKDKVYATSAADGKELWSEKVPGEVQDLAFAAGRLFVVTDSGAIVCFGQ